MTKKVMTSLTTMLLTVMLVNCFCERLASSKDYSEPVEKIFNKIQMTKNETELDKISESKNPTFTAVIEKICGKPDKSLIKNKQDEKLILGKGGFGTVLNLEINESRKAVKQVNLFAMAWEYVESSANASKKALEACKNDLTKRIATQMAKFEKENELETKIVDIVRGAVKDQNECSALDESFKSYIKKLAPSIQYEIEVISELSDDSRKDEQIKAFPIIDKCFIDDNFKIYFVGEKLGADLSLVLKACQYRPLYEDRAGRMVELALEAMLLVHTLHTKGKHHCDLKPSNIMFTNKLMHSLKLIDFSLVSAKTSECRGGTVGFIPVDDKRVKTKEEMTNAKLRADFNKRHDHFALGMTLLEVFVGPEDPLFKTLKKQAAGFAGSNVDWVTDGNSFVNQLHAITTRKKEEIKKYENKEDLRNSLTIEYLMLSIAAWMTYFDDQVRISTQTGLYLTHQLYAYYNSEGRKSKSQFYKDHFEDKKTLKLKSEESAWIEEVKKTVVEFRKSKAKQYQKYMEAASQNNKEIII